MRTGGGLHERAGVFLGRDQAQYALGYSREQRETGSWYTKQAYDGEMVFIYEHAGVVSGWCPADGWC